MARRVLVNDDFVDKAGAQVASDDVLRVAELERDSAIVFVVTRADVAFRAPARLGDLLMVGVDIVEHGRARFIARQVILRNDLLVAAATITLACLDKSTWKPRKMPSNLLEPLT